MNDHATGVFEAERDRLISLAYRMLGERSGAEDVVQNAWLRWASSARDTIREPAAWLTTVTTRLAIDALTSARARRETYVGVWLPEPWRDTGTDPAPTPEDRLIEQQSVELALLWAMERLAPKERAAYILREAFDCSFDEIAETLETSPANARQLVSRARARIADNDIRFDVEAQEVADLLERFMGAAATTNPAEVIALLSPDAIALSDGGGKARAALRPLRGPEEITHVFLSIAEKNGALPGVEMGVLNGQPALLVLNGDEQDMAITVRPNASGAIGWIYIMRNPDKLERLRAEPARTALTDP